MDALLKNLDIYFAGVDPFFQDAFLNNQGNHSPKTFLHDEKK
jgi:hypothetical protein